MSRYYAVNKYGEIVAESDSREVLEYYILSDYGFDEKKIEEDEIEIRKWK